MAGNLSLYRRYVRVMSILLFLSENLHGCNEVAKGVGRDVDGMRLMRRGYR